MKKLFLTISTLVFLIAACAPAATPAAPPTAIVVSDQYEYCQLQPGADIVSQGAAGTPIPPEKWVTLTTGDINILKTMAFYLNLPRGRDASHALVVLVPVGFENSAIPGVMDPLLAKLYTNFAGVNIDAGYIDRSIPIGINHLERNAGFVNWDEFYAFRDHAKDLLKENPFLVFIVNTDVYMGVGFEGGSIQAAFNENVDYLLTHETGHAFGLDDGYQDYYKPEELPNGELWYSDAQSETLKKAVAETGQTPLTYQVGTCNGRVLYTYYDPSYNIMADFYDKKQVPDNNTPWGSVFTPIQIHIMNNTIQGKTGQ